MPTLSKRQLRGATIVAVILGSALALVLVIATQPSAEAACAGWRADYRVAVRAASQAIDNGDEEMTEPAFDRLNELDRDRPKSCPVPAESIRPRCIECGHE